MNSLKKTDQLLFAALRTALWGEELPASSFADLKADEWKQLYQTSAEQGVLALVFDAVQQLSAEHQPPRSLKLQWAVSVQQIEQRYAKQLRLASELAQIYHDRGIKTIVLKGFAISGYYSVPEHRECGDLDCFLVRTDDSQQQGCEPPINAEGRPVPCYVEGNRAAKEAGADVEIGFYKHSHINYKGLMVENHQFCTAVRGYRDRKALERHLQALLVAEPLTSVGDSHLCRPCADFNALFITAHSFGHFLTEGIKLRHILDWTALLKTEQGNIDWTSFYEWCDKMHYTKFVDALTAISIQHFGLVVMNELVHQHSDFADRVLDDVMHSKHSIHNTKSSIFQKRLMIIRNHLFGGWKYRELYEKSAFLNTMKMVAAFFFERKPKI